jgi:hypothetical protein
MNAIQVLRDKINTNELIIQDTYDILDGIVNENKVDESRELVAQIEEYIAENNELEKAILHLESIE